MKHRKQEISAAYMYMDMLSYSYTYSVDGPQGTKGGTLQSLSSTSELRVEKITGPIGRYVGVGRGGGRLNDTRKCQRPYAWTCERILCVITIHLAIDSSIS